MTLQQSSEKEVLKDIIKLYSFILEKHPELAKEFKQFMEEDRKE
jgi:hypothetical protein